MVSDELPDTTFTVTVDNQSVIHLTFFKISEKAAEHKSQAEAIQAIVHKLLQKNPRQRYDTVVDARAIRHTMFLAMDAQVIYLNLMKQPQIKRLAFVATGRFLKIMTSVFTQFTGKAASVKWFEEIDQALAWLHQKA
ncbi:MAG: STAS/SEC14 domain-containing protein [Candidatus Andersenbacteria bacterium]